MNDPIIRDLVWRCSVCEGCLGIVGSSRFCPRCGIRLCGGGHE